MTSHAKRWTYATADQMASVDRAMFSVCGLDVLQVMETAGRMVAVMARQMLDGEVAGKRITAVCGTGGNGGDGMVAARHLLGWGAKPTILMSGYPGAESVTARQMQIARNLRLPVIDAPADMPSELSGDLLIDGLLGFGSHGSPTGTTADLIRLINAASAPVLAIDQPSGVDATTGTVHDPAVRADVTLTLALPKTGFEHPEAKAFLGDVWVADIGVPDLAFAHAGLVVPSRWTTDLQRLVP